MLNLFKIKKLQAGFTLIELLIVIAILGILTTAVLVAINPLEQFARGRDAGRATLVDQVGHAVQAYYTAQGAYPTLNNAWMTSLVNSQDIKTVPDNSGVNNTATPCTGTAFAQANLCYNTNGTDAVVYAVQSSDSQKIKAGGAAKCATITFIVWSSAAGRTGLYCSNTEPTVGMTNLVF